MEDDLWCNYSDLPSVMSYEQPKKIYLSNMKYLITESSLKSLIKDKFNIDLTGRVEFDPNIYRILNDFDRCTDYQSLKRRLSMDNYGPMYLIELENSYTMLYQMNYTTNIPWIINNGCDTWGESDFMNFLGISGLGITMEQFLDLYV